MEANASFRPPHAAWRMTGFYRRAIARVDTEERPHETIAPQSLVRGLVNHPAAVWLDELHADGEVALRCNRAIGHARR